MHRTLWRRDHPALWALHRRGMSSRENTPHFPSRGGVPERRGGLFFSGRQGDSL